MPGGPFGLFEDTANLHAFGRHASLNVVASKCHPDEEPQWMREWGVGGSAAQAASLARRRALLETVYAATRALVPSRVEEALARDEQRDLPSL